MTNFSTGQLKKGKQLDLSYTAIILTKKTFWSSSSSFVTNSRGLLVSSGAFIIKFHVGSSEHAQNYLEAGAKYEGILFEFEKENASS